MTGSLLSDETGKGMVRVVHFETADIRLVLYHLKLQNSTSRTSGYHCVPVLVEKLIAGNVHKFDTYQDCGRTYELRYKMALRKSPVLNHSRALPQQ